MCRWATERKDAWAVVVQKERDVPASQPADTCQDLEPVCQQSGGSEVARIEKSKFKTHEFKSCITPGMWASRRSPGSSFGKGFRRSPVWVPRHSR